MTERKQTDPGGWQSPLGSVDPRDQDDIATQPEAADPCVASLARVFGDLGVADRQRVLKVVTNWSNSNETRRVILESISHEFAHAKD